MHKCVQSFILLLYALRLYYIFDKIIYMYVLIGDIFLDFDWSETSLGEPPPSPCCRHVL